MMDWRSKAACLTVDPELFFPIGNTGPAVTQAAQAKAVCRECTVKGICRALKRRAARARRAGC